MLCCWQSFFWMDINSHIRNAWFACASTVLIFQFNSMYTIIHSLPFPNSSDCIGSAFNIKGMMQCPNCRKVEKGSWLYASGSRSQPDLGFDEWTHDEDLYELSYSEMV